MRPENLSGVLKGMIVNSGNRSCLSPPFKAGVGDKFIFIKILRELSRNLDYAERELDEDLQGVSYTCVGANILRLFYFPRYSWWDERKLRELKEELAGRQT